MRKAKELFEYSLLEYIHHDGSSGRLFYDIARSCKFLHPLGTSQSTSVMQRNPFSPNHEMGWMNIVELPFVGDSSGRSYHSFYLVSKQTGVLGRIKRETRCEIKICSNKAKVPTKYCDPYVWVMGDQPALVDKAVDILQEAIRKHMSECNCRLWKCEQVKFTWPLIEFVCRDRKIILI